MDIVVGCNGSLNGTVLLRSPFIAQEGIPNWKTVYSELSDQTIGKGEMKKIGSLLLIVVLLGGCAPTLESIKQDPALVDTQIVNGNYQAVFRHMLKMYRNCFYRGGLFGEAKVENNLYTDIKKGEILFLWMSSEIFYLDENSTKVISRVGLSTWKLRIANAAKWAQGSKECE